VIESIGFLVTIVVVVIVAELLAFPLVVVLIRSRLVTTSVLSTERILLLITHQLITT
jgi:hypothetical protein